MFGGGGAELDQILDFENLEFFLLDFLKGNHLNLFLF